MDEVCPSSSNVNIEEGTAITVVVRIRPQNARELAVSHGNLIHVLDDKVLVFDPPGERVHKQTFINNSQGRSKNLSFGFDRVFGQESSQDDVFEVVKSTIFQEKGGLLDGFNCTVFAYGATGSGKTFTMAGTKENPGIMSRSVQYIFEAIDARMGRNAKIRLSYLEIYNEEIRDLLNPVDDRNKEKELKIVDDPVEGITVTGLSYAYPKDTYEVLKLVHIGNSRRTQAQTDANPVSSRSHAILQIVVENCDDVPGTHTISRIGKLSLIDLAGSERATQNTGARLRETTKINGSLLALSNCINMLCKGSSYIPFRQSKLTRLLKDSLGGNCKTICLSCISSSYLTYDDTYNTLQYANKAKNIKTNVLRNTLDVKAHINEYQQMIEKLRSQVKTLQTQTINVGAIESYKRSLEDPFFQQRMMIDNLISQYRIPMESNAKEQIAAIEKTNSLDIKHKCSQRVASFTSEAVKRRPIDNSMIRWFEQEHKIKSLELENYALKGCSKMFETQILVLQKIIQDNIGSKNNSVRKPLSSLLPNNSRKECRNTISNEIFKFEPFKIDSRRGSRSDIRKLANKSESSYVTHSKYNTNIVREHDRFRYGYCSTNKHCKSHRTERSYSRKDSIVSKVDEFAGFHRYNDTTVSDFLQFEENITPDFSKSAVFRPEELQHSMSSINPANSSVLHVHNPFIHQQNKSLYEDACNIKSNRNNVHRSVIKEEKYHLSPPKRSKSLESQFESRNTKKYSYFGEDDVSLSDDGCSSTSDIETPKPFNINKDLILNCDDDDDDAESCISLAPIVKQGRGSLPRKNKLQDDTQGCSQSTPEQRSSFIHRKFEEALESQQRIPLSERNGNFVNNGVNKKPFESLLAQLSSKITMMKNKSDTPSVGLKIIKA